MADSILPSARLGPSPAAYAWVALVPVALLEQGPGSDQDNALALSDDDDCRRQPGSGWRPSSSMAVAGDPAAGDIMADEGPVALSVRGVVAMFAGCIHQPVPDVIFVGDLDLDVHGTIRRGGRQQQIRLRSVQRPVPRRSREERRRDEPLLGFFRGFVQREAQQEHARPARWSTRRRWRSRARPSRRPGRNALLDRGRRGRWCRQRRAGRPSRRVR